ncbi:dihydroxy-acid dehydratase [Rhodoligotrophos appendicifer]|uniref:IlvD/Edd family dehydratase n=1 Tax=Rhodoligotrophos appendicifer TaxID=987056 RepID=UPI0011863B4E|nr:IlvD/Edd family dehydratase [Rhodoligotrophos appendicifer]
MTTRVSRSLRSQRWFGPLDYSAMGARGLLKNQGWPEDLFDGRPVVGICNTWSELSPCNGHLRDLAEAVKRGVWEAGGFPLEFPVSSVGETLAKPTAMLFRNLISMDVEESIRAHPMDGVVLLCGCDKTTPALLMGAASVDLPAIVVSSGPMLSSRFRGRKAGSGTHDYKVFTEYRAGTVSAAELLNFECIVNRSAGTCMTMGTASSMASMVEAMGLSLTGNAAIPAVDARRRRLAQLSGRQIVTMIHDDLRLSKLLTRDAFENAIMVNSAVGGSTNSVLHLLAIAGRVGVDITLDDWDRLGAATPLLLNLMPSGDYLMEDFFEAGGLPALMSEIADSLHLAAPGCCGRTIGQRIAGACNSDPDIIRPRSKELRPSGGVAVLRGNLAERGAIIKTTAATDGLLSHRGKAVVFESLEDLEARIDDPHLNVGPDDVLVLRNCGPRGFPGMPEVGAIPIPRKLLAQGVRDMVRLSDARMSGTYFGTVILHIAPESAVGGTLALVASGDIIELDVEHRRLHLDVGETELARRRALWQAPQPRLHSGYESLYVNTVTQADEGCDLDFLRGCRGADPRWGL